MTETIDRVEVITSGQAADRLGSDFDARPPHLGQVLL